MASSILGAFEGVKTKKKNKDDIQYIYYKDYEVAQYYVKKLLKITYVGCVIWDTLIFVLTPLILNLYNLSSETIQLVIILCLLHNILSCIHQDLF